MENENIIKKNGFTLIEVLITGALCTVLAAAVISTMIAWQHSRNIGGLQMDVQTEASRAMRSMREDLVQAGVNCDPVLQSCLPIRGINTLTIGTFINPNNNIVTFQVPTGYIGGIPTWGNVIQYSLGGLNGQQLLRTNLTTGVATVEANNITVIQFTANIVNPAEFPPNPGPLDFNTNNAGSVLNIQLTASKTRSAGGGGAVGDTLTINLDSQVNLRN